MRVRADSLQVGDLIRLEGNRVLITDLEDREELGDFVRIKGNYYKPPDFSVRVDVTPVLCRRRRVTLIQPALKDETP